MSNDKVIWSVSLMMLGLNCCNVGAGTRGEGIDTKYNECRVLYPVHELDRLPVASFPEISLTFSVRMVHSTCDVGCLLRMSMRYKTAILN